MVVCGNLAAVSFPIGREIEDVHRKLPVTDHIATDELADAAEGLLDPARADIVARHVDGCAACTQTAQILEGLPAVLAAEPAPPMPAAISARLQQAVTTESERRSAGIAPTSGPGAEPWQARPSLGNFNEGFNKPGRSSLWYRALVAAAVATMVGFIGFFVSSTAGLNEPTAAQRVVLSSHSLAPQLNSLNHRGLDAHLFSAAWRCARQVTDGSVSGIRKATIDGAPAMLVYQERDNQTVVTIVTGCDSGHPEAGRTTTLDG